MGNPPSVFQRFKKAWVAAAGVVAVVTPTIAAADVTTWQGIGLAVLGIFTVLGVRQATNVE